MTRTSPADPLGTRLRRARAAFTLLEVLAAVLIFAITFTALAGHTMSWVRAEGVSARRLRASLLADDQMTELEGRIALGETPPIGEEETEIDEFQMTVSVDPWQPPFDLGDAEGQPGSAEPSLLLPAAGDPDGVLRRIRVVVRWEEGFDEHLVSRTTFALDAAAAKQLLESAGFAAGGTGEDEEEAGDLEGTPP